MGIDPILTIVFLYPCISGLFHCLAKLVFLEEVGGGYEGWDALRSTGIAESKASASSYERRLKFCLTYFTFFLRLVLLAAAILSVIWDVMFFSTVLFFHTLTEKLVATALAVFAWLVLYQGIYTLPISYGLPSAQAGLALQRLRAF